MASFRTQPCNILVHDGRDTKDFGCRCCKNIRRGNFTFTKTLASNTANGQETSLYSRSAQQSITRFYLASPILKASCPCIHILHFQKHCRRGDLPCCTYSIYKLQTFHKMALDSTMEPILRHIPKLSKRRGFE